ncbi:MAG: mechanosensitive ion channel [Kiritimatiellae bacterium]|nr:mechanosensitive ion channel [Kiritimatiellia bacterium]
MKEILLALSSYLSQIGLNPLLSKIVSSLICLVATILIGAALCATISFLVKKSVFNSPTVQSHKENTTQLLRSSLRLVFLWILHAWIPGSLVWNEVASMVVSRILGVAVTVAAASAVCAGISWIASIERIKTKAKNLSSKIMVQVVKIIAWSTASIIIVSILMGKSPVFILSGLGALTAVLMLIFKDSIIGLVAGVQVAQNDMVRVGDWITMSKYNADGNVIDIALTTVKVQNFDNTVTMIPSSALINDSFINWRYMSDSKGRRIKRPVWISATSIREMNEELKADLVKQGLIKETDNPISNLAAFELWLERMLEANDDITKELTCMVRQTEPSDTGIPVEIYAFTKTRNWVEYERIQTALFDLIFIFAPKFSLQIYQRTGDKGLVF